MPRRQLSDRLFLERLEQRVLLAGDLPALDSESFRPQTAEVASESFHSAASIALDASSSNSRKVQGTIGWFDRSDTFRVNIGTDSDARLRLDGLRANADLYLYDAQGRPIARSTRGGRSAEQIEQQLGSGTYFVKIQSSDRFWTNYQLTVTTTSVTPPTSPPISPPRQPMDAAPPTPPQPVETPAPNTPIELPSVSYYGGSSDWNVNLVNAPEAWSAGYSGEGVTVAVIDTGVDRTHIELSDSIWRNEGEISGDGLDNDGNGFVDDIFGWNFADDNNDTRDTNGHGTHVAGTITAARNNRGSTGIAYDAEIMPVRVLSDNGKGTSWSVAAGIRYAVDNDADIINLSLGGGYSSAIYAAVEYAANNGVFVVVASGNESSATPSHPAQASLGTTAISVGAHNSSNTLAGFSNRVGQSGAVQVDAPGVGVVSTLPGNRYGSFSGTSMAAPHVSGIAALALSAASELTPAQLRDLITEGASRSIRNSDSIGGVNAAITVGHAVAERQVGSSTATVAAFARNSARNSPTTLQAQRWTWRLSSRANYKITAVGDSESPSIEPVGFADSATEFEQLDEVALTDISAHWPTAESNATADKAALAHVAIASEEQRESAFEGAELEHFWAQFEPDALWDVFAAVKGPAA